MFQTHGHLTIKVIEAFCSSFDNLTNDKETQQKRNKKNNKIKVADVMSEVRIISTGFSSSSQIIEPTIIKTIRSIPTLCSLLPNEGKGNCLIGDEIVVENLSSNSVISVSLLADISKSLKCTETVTEKNIIELGYVDIPMQRLQPNTPITQWYQLLHPWTKENVQSTIRIELLFCENIESNSRIVSNKSMTNEVSQTLDETLLALDIDILPTENNSEFSSPDCNHDKKSLFRPDSVEYVKKSNNDNNSTPSTNDKNNDDVVKNIMNKRLPVGLVDYFILVGPIDECVHCPLHGCKNNPSKITTNVYAAEPLSPLTPMSPTVSNALECIIWDRFPKIDYAHNPLPTKIEWFIAPEGPATICSKDRPEHRISSFVLSTGESSGQQFGLKLRFFYQIESPCKELSISSSANSGNSSPNKSPLKSNILKNSIPWKRHLKYNRSEKTNRKASFSINQSDNYNSLYISIDLSILSQYSFINQLSRCLDIIYIYYILPSLILYEKKIIESSDNGNITLLNENLSTLLLNIEHIMVSLCLETPTPIPSLYSVNLQLPINQSLPNYLPRYIFNYISNQLSIKQSDQFYNINFSINQISGVPECPYPLLFLVHLLGPRVTLNIFYAVLSESRILFHTKRLYLLPIICESIVTLLYPLKWCHVYLPIVPLALLDVIEAPVPYLLGTNSSWIQYLSYDCLDNVVAVDIDNGCIDQRKAKTLSFPNDIDRWLMLSMKTILHNNPIDGNIDTYISKYIDKNENTQNNICKGSVQLQILVYDVMISLLRNIPHCLFYLDRNTPIFNRPLFLDEFIPISCKPCLEILTDTNAFHRFVDVINNNEYSYFLERSEKFPIENENNIETTVFSPKSNMSSRSKYERNENVKFDSIVKTPKLSNSRPSTAKSFRLTKEEKLMSKTLSFSFKNNEITQDIMDSKFDFSVDNKVTNRAVDVITPRTLLNKKKSWHSLLPHSPFTPNRTNVLLDSDVDDDDDHELSIPNLSKLQSNVVSPTISALKKNKKVANSKVSSTSSSMKDKNEVITDIDMIFDDITTPKNSNNNVDNDCCLPDWLYYTSSNNNLNIKFKNQLYYYDIITLMNNRISIYIDSYNKLLLTNNDPILNIIVSSDHKFNEKNEEANHSLSYKSIDSFINPDLFVDVGSPFPMSNPSSNSMPFSRVDDVTPSRNSIPFDRVENDKVDNKFRNSIPFARIDSNEDEKTSNRIDRDTRAKSLSMSRSYDLHSNSSHNNSSFTLDNTLASDVITNRVVFPRRKSTIDTSVYVNINLNKSSTNIERSRALSNHSMSSSNSSVSKSYNIIQTVTPTKSNDSIDINAKIVNNKRYSISHVKTKRSSISGHIITDLNKSNEDILDGNHKHSNRIKRSSIHSFSHASDLKDNKIDNRISSSRNSVKSDEVKSKANQMLEGDDNIDDQNNNSLSIDITTFNFLSNSNKITTIHKINFNHNVINSLITSMKSWTMVDISNYFNDSYSNFYNKYNSIIDSNNNTYTNRYITSTSHPSSQNTMLSTSLSLDLNKGINSHWLDNSPSHESIDLILLDYLKVIISGNYINDIEFFLIRKQVYTILLDTMKRKKFIDLLKQSNRSNNNQNDKKNDKKIKTDKANIPIYYPLNDKPFTILIELFIEMLHICSIQNSYIDAYDLLIASGFYFNASNSNDMNNSNELNIEFLSSHLLHHPIYHKTELWKSVLYNRISLDDNNLKNNIIIEIHSILYMMSSLGINPERALLLIQDIIEEFKLDISNFIHLKNFIINLWPNNNNNSSNSLSNIVSYDDNHIDQHGEDISDECSYSSNSSYHNDNNNDLDIDYTFEKESKSLDTVSIDNNITKETSKESNKIINDTSSKKSNEPVKKSWFRRKFFGK